MMSKIKGIIRWVVGILLVLYLGIVLLISLPFVQGWIGGQIADVLSEKLGHTRVEVGRVQLGLTGRLIIDDIKIWDQQNKEMISVARTGAKVSILPLIKNKDIHINNAILFGAHASFYQATPESDINLQFLIDAFKSDEEKKPLPNISVGSLLVRHTSVSFDKLWEPETPGVFNKNHVKIQELSISAQLDHLNDDSLSVSIRKFSCQEQSGFLVKHLEAKIKKKYDILNIGSFILNTANSDITIPSMTFDLSKIKGEGSVQAHLVPSDAKAFLPKLDETDISLDTRLSFVADTTSVQISDFVLSSTDESLVSELPFIEINNLKDSIPDFDVKVKLLSCSPQVVEHIKPFLTSFPKQASDVIDVLGQTTVEGSFNKEKSKYVADTEISTNLGNVNINACYDNNHLNGNVQTDQFKLGKLLSALNVNAVKDSTALVDHIAFSADADLTLPISNLSTGTKSVLSKLPSGSAKIEVKEAVIKRYAYHNISLSLNRNGENCLLAIDARDPALSLNFQGNAKIAQNDYSLQGVLDVLHLRLQDMNITKEGLTDLRTKIGVDIAGDKVENIKGDISIPHVILTDDNGDYTLSSIQLISKVDDNNRHIALTSPYLSTIVDGNFEWKDLISFAQQTVHHWIPSVVKAPATQHEECQANIGVKITDLTPLERFANVPLRFKDGPFKLDAEIDSRHRIIDIEASTPSLTYGDQEILNLSLSTRSQNDDMTTRFSIAKQIKNNPVDFSFRVDAKEEVLTTQFNWDDHLEHVTKGTIALQGKLLREGSKISIDGEVLPTSFQVSDTLWNIQPAKIAFNDGVLNIKDFRVQMEDDNRWLTINGKASKSASDSLFIDLQGIELGYIFDFMHVKPIHMGGLVSGHLYGIHLFDQAEAHGDITVPHVYLNKGDLGFCTAKLHWGVKPGNLDLEVLTRDEANNSWIKANGWLHLIKDPDQMLDLNFEIQRGNMYLINRYTEGIMEDVQARATGKLRVYGTFGDVNLDGDALVEEAAMTIPSIGVRYHAVNQTLSVRPDGVILNNITGYDPMGGPGIEGHQATINGRINYDHFRDMNYHFTIDGDNVLVYNFADFGDMPICGVVNGSGKVDIKGRPGVTNIEIDARPTEGTQMIYKVASPKTLTQSKFITFVDHDSPLDAKDNNNEDDDQNEKPTGDMYINFNLDITPEAELRLLMDPAAGDYISLFGDSRLRCTYYNKGNFRMYGTYRVDHGIYRMSIQNAIRKDFQFSKGGTLVFGGNPFDADLGLQAVYTVPSVSLNDLSARGTFSNNTVRVNCLMNLGGKAGAPRISFDFDIPNVNEDELRMVRSLISTEEERNLQVIYLLGIGRFYTYDYTGSQTQSSTAMNSLLSSTLSGQLNQMFSSIMGSNQNWNIGANLSTGETGWSDMDVEGILSGRLLNNRLLINGNFGYRDNPVAASNFIGDFDLQWILNRNGNLILKAYSETNDRYFTKSALTTQGIGILLKKDFIRWTDLFKRKSHKVTPVQNDNQSQSTSSN